jgi:hypothetical protein
MMQRYRTAFLTVATFFWLVMENCLLRMAFAIRQFDEALEHARSSKKGLLTAWRYWRELRREYYLAVRLMRLGHGLVPQDEAELAAVCQGWDDVGPPQQIQAELLQRLSHFAPGHHWDLAKAQRVGANTGLAPESLLQLLRERQSQAGND